MEEFIVHQHEADRAARLAAAKLLLEKGEAGAHVPKFDTAVIIGGGAFGTCIGSVLANNFKTVVFKVRSQDVYGAILRGENDIYLKSKRLASNMLPALTWAEVDERRAGGKVDLIVSGLPTKAIRSALGEAETHAWVDANLALGVPLVSLSKGMDTDTLELPDDLMFHLFPARTDSFAFLSGPSFAAEVMDNQITLVSLAGNSKQTLETCVIMFKTAFFTVLPSYDVKGTLLGGALKNVVAIAAGVLEGLGYNHNTNAALITRGVHEMLRFGKVLCGMPETFYGPSGVGDLILTTTGGLSRNKQFGLSLARGEKAEDILREHRYVVEGYLTTLAAHKFAQKYGIRAPIFEAVYQVVYGGVNVKEAVAGLMSLTFVLNPNI